jgi:hypothetical protein
MTGRQPVRRGLTLDAGALLGVDKGDEDVRALIRTAREMRLPLAVPAGALGQVWRDGARQARLAGFLRTSNGPELVPLDGRAARSAGELCGRAGTADVIDASVVLCARVRGHDVVTSDPRDIHRLDERLALIAV